MPSEFRKTLFGHDAVPHRETELPKAEHASPLLQIDTLGWRMLPLTRTALTFNGKIKSSALTISLKNLEKSSILKLLTFEPPHHHQPWRKHLQRPHLASYGSLRILKIHVPMPSCKK